MKSRPEKKKKIDSKQAMEGNQLLYDAEVNKIPKYTSENGKAKKDPGPFPKRKKFYKTSGIFVSSHKQFEIRSKQHYTP